MIEKSVDTYLEFMVREFYDGLVILKESSYLDDDELDTVYAYGYNLFTYGKYEKAKEIFEKLAKEARYSYLWRALGAVNQQLRKFDDAIMAYDTAIEKNKNDIVSYAYRGETKILSGYVKDALKDFEKVLKIGDPNIDKAWIKRSSLLLDIHSKSKMTKQIKDGYSTEDQFILTLDVDEEDVDFEILEKEIGEIPEIKKIEKTPTMSIGIALLLVLLTPFITEIIRVKSHIAIKRFKEIILNILDLSKKSSDKAKVTIQYKSLIINIKTEEEIEQYVDRLVNYD